MFSRRLHHLVARLALAWFALALGAAVASPLVHPRSMQLVCSASGAVKWLVDDGAGLAEVGHASLDCALCLPLSAPPAQPPAMPTLPGPLALSVAERVQAAPVVAAARAPLPARGPPACS